jgi:hypothetical protein
MTIPKHALKSRGLRGVRLVTSDDHRGLKAAIDRHFQGASWNSGLERGDGHCRAGDSHHHGGDRLAELRPMRMLRWEIDGAGADRFAQGTSGNVRHPFTVVAGDPERDFRNDGK